MLAPVDPARPRRERLRRRADVRLELGPRGAPLLAVDVDRDEARRAAHREPDVRVRAEPARVANGVDVARGPLLPCALDRMLAWSRARRAPAGADEAAVHDAHAPHGQDAESVRGVCDSGLEERRVVGRQPVHAHAATPLARRNGAIAPVVWARAIGGSERKNRAP